MLYSTNEYRLLRSGGGGGQGEKVNNLEIRNKEAAFIYSAQKVFAPSRWVHLFDCHIKILQVNTFWSTVENQKLKWCITSISYTVFAKLSLFSPCITRLLYKCVLWFCFQLLKRGSRICLVSTSLSNCMISMIATVSPWLETHCMCTHS